MPIVLNFVSLHVNTMGRPGEYYLKSARTKIVDKLPTTNSDWKKEFFFVRLEHPLTKEPWVWNFKAINLTKKNEGKMSEREEVTYEKIRTDLEKKDVDVLSDEFLKEHGIWTSPPRKKINWVSL